MTGSRALTGMEVAGPAETTASELTRRQGIHMLRLASHDRIHSLL